MWILRTGFVLAAMAACACAQPRLPEQERLLARRAAEADAYRKLVELIDGVRLDTSLRVRQIAAESDEIRAALDDFLSGARLGEATFLDDGTCEVPAEVTTEALVGRLRSAASQAKVGPAADAAIWSKLEQSADRKVLRVVGRSSVRESLPPGLPPAIVSKLGGLGADPRDFLPLSWKDVPSRERLMAVEAARKDAQRRLAERIAGLRVTANSIVRDYVAEADEIVTELSAHLVGAQESGPPYYHDDSLIVEVPMTLPAESVVTAVRRLHEQHAKAAGIDLSPDALERRVRSVVKRELTAVGRGVPRVETLRELRTTLPAAPVTSSTKLVRWPAWAEQDILGEGRGADPELGTPQGKLRAARSAERAAREKLADAIAGLPVADRQRVADVTTGREDLGGLLDAVVGEADVAATRFDGDGAIVTVRVSGMRVWDVLNGGMRDK